MLIAPTKRKLRSGFGRQQLSTKSTFPAYGFGSGAREAIGKVAPDHRCKSNVTDFFGSSPAFVQQAGASAGPEHA